MTYRGDTDQHYAVHGAVLRALRTASGIGLRELARRTELPPSTIRDLETGRRRTTRDRITRIAAALDIPVEALLKDVA